VRVRRDQPAVRGPLFGRVRGRSTGTIGTAGATGRPSVRRRKIFPPPTAARRIVGYGCQASHPTPCPVVPRIPRPRSARVGVV